MTLTYIYCCAMLQFVSQGREGNKAFVVGVPCEKALEDQPGRGAGDKHMK
jgi:hypothetical protein